MIYTGIDHHKRYSVACTLDVQGQKLHEARIDGNVPGVGERVGERGQALGFGVEGVGRS